MSFKCPNNGCVFQCKSSFALSRHKCKVALLNKRRKPNSDNHFNTTSTSFQPVNHSDNIDFRTIPDTSFENEDFTGENNNQNVQHDSNSNNMELIQRFCEVLDLCTTKSSLHIFNTILDILTDKDFSIDKFRDNITTVESCHRFTATHLAKKVEKHGFQQYEVNCSVNDTVHKGLYFKRDILATLKNQLLKASDKDIVFSDSNSTNEFNINSSTSESVKHPLHSPFFQDLHFKIKNQKMASSDDTVFWSENENNKSFPGFIQIFTDKTVTTLKPGGMVAHAVHVTFINFTKQFRRYLITHGHTIVGFLPTASISRGTHSKITEETDNNLLYSSIPTPPIEDLCEEEYQPAHSSCKPIKSGEGHVIALEDNIGLTSSNSGRQVKILLIHNCMKEILKPLMQTVVSGFPIHKATDICWTCFPFLVSFCCDIPEAKDIAAILHNLNTRCPCHRCLVTLECIQKLIRKPSRTMNLTKFIRRNVKKILKSNKAIMDKKCFNELKHWSLAQWTSFLEDLHDAFPDFIVDDVYSIFTFEPLHNLHLGTSKMLKLLFFLLLSSNLLVCFPHMKGKRNVSINSKRAAILRACNSLLKVLEEDCDISNLHVDFSVKEASTTLNGLFLETGVKGMLEGKDYKQLDYVFPFVMAFVDRITGMIDNGQTKVHTMYSDLLYQLYHNIERNGLNPQTADSLEQHIALFKQTCKDIFEKHVNRGLFTLKFHLLDHLVEDLRKYGTLDFLDAGPYENYNATIKGFYKLTSKRKQTAFQETINKMNSSQDDDPLNNGLSSTLNGEVDQHLVRDGFTVTFRQLKEIFSDNISGPLLALKTQLLTVLSISDIPVLANLIEDKLRSHSVQVLDFEVLLTVVKSGYIDSYTTPSMSCYRKEKNVAVFQETPTHERQRKRVMATNSFGPTSKKIFSSIFMKSSDNEFWFAKTMLLFHLSVPGFNLKEELAMVKFYTCTPPLDKIDDTLNCICLRWETEENTDYTIPGTEHDNTITATEKYDLISFQSICGVAHILRSNYAIPPFTEELPWTHHRFYVNRFIP